MREHDVTALTTRELDRARRELAASLALVRLDSPARVPILAHLTAIDTELAWRTGKQLSADKYLGCANELYLMWRPLGPGTAGGFAEQTMPGDASPADRLRARPLPGRGHLPHDLMPASLPPTWTA